MYIGDDTRTMTFVLREVMHLHTPQLPINTGSTTVAPGKILRIIANPLRAMLRKEGNAYRTNTLGMTASRWREIRYVGTRVQFVPLATTGRIDPADITQSGSGVPNAEGEFSPQGSVHPYDALNFLHWRRWVGGNFNIPAWPATAAVDRKAYVDKSLTYDQQWLSDDRFNHAKLTDGFSFDSVPLRVDLETSALAGNSLFGFSSDMHVFAARDQLSFSTGAATSDAAKSSASGWKIGDTRKDVENARNYVFAPGLDQYFQPQGLIAPTAGKDYHEQGWLPNPFAGLTYKLPNGVTEIKPGSEEYEVAGYIPEFPWFADRPDISTADQTFAYFVPGNSNASVTKYGALLSFDLDYLIKLCIERFISPIGIIRLPPAYGSMFYWTGYMAHVFQLRKPFLSNSAWTVGLVENLAHDITPLNAMLGEDDVERRSMLIPAGEQHIYQAVGPDPYGLAESPATVSLVDIAPHMHPFAEPRRVDIIQPEEVKTDGSDTRVSGDSPEQE